MKISWNSLEEKENIERFGISFTEAAQVVKNSTSFRIRNIERDFIFIGPVDDISKILLVSCRIEEGFRTIQWARKATSKEESAYFMHLATGELK